MERGDLVPRGEGLEDVVDELLNGVEEVDEEPLVVLHLDKQCLEVVHQATDAAELIEEHAGVGAALGATESLVVGDDLQAGEKRGEDVVVDVLGEETASTSRGGHGGCLARSLSSFLQLVLLLSKTPTTYGPGKRGEEIMDVR